MTIGDNVRMILAELPDGVELVAAAKNRTPEEVVEAVEEGVRIVGENYVQEAERARVVVGDRVRWHFIGRLQGNKAKKAVGIFDMIETVDSVEIAGEIDNRCRQIGKTMPVLVEVNSGREAQKTGVMPEHAGQLIREITSLPNIRVMGLMTMGPASGHPDETRRCFAETRKLKENIAGLDLAGVEMRYLSMGMTDTYMIAVEEGANIVRIGTKIFGQRGAEA